MNSKLKCNKVILCIDCHRVLGLLPKGGGGIQSNLNHHNDGYMFCRYRHHSNGTVELGQSKRSTHKKSTNYYQLTGFWGDLHKRMGWDK